MNIDPQSSMRFGDVDGLRDFFFVHRLVHAEVDAVIAASGKGSLPSATIDSSVALDAWVAAMQADKEELAPGDDSALNDWLQLHDNLHQAEYDALGLGDSPDLSDVDFRDDRQFYQWMFAHQSVHDALGSATGVV